VLNQRQLECFVQVARHKHFGKAAQILSVSQPALSQAIRKLEAQLGFELFVRTTRDVSLTPAGEVFLEDAVATLAQMERMVGRARQAAKNGAGTLAVGYVALVRKTAVRLIAEIARVRPGIEVTHRQEYTPQLVADLRAAALDAALLVEQPLPAELESLPLRDLPLVCVVSDRHPLAALDQVSLSEVASYPIAFVRIPGTGHWAPALEGVFIAQGLHPELVPLDGPVGEQPIVEHEQADRFVWVQTDEFDSGWGRRIPFVPAVTLRFAIAWRTGEAEPALVDFVRHARECSGRERWLATHVDRGDVVGLHRR